ncbi:hypothetical protein [Pantanalinema sp. GBBB05]|uniref:hypothetical protein n=1 Tax=Pantanalinema sp. GBBB05 TaxID=2604139 RepID=UPI001DE9604A|nr:hypothetical protein [Pantanalinema sp. GBBB05]
MSTSFVTVFSLIILVCGWLAVDRPVVAQPLPSTSPLNLSESLPPLDLTYHSDRRLATSSNTEREGLPRRRADGGSR